MKAGSDRKKEATSHDGALVEAVEPGSLGEEIGLAAGDRLMTIDGHPLKDVIEYKYRLAGEQVNLRVRKADGEEWEIELEKGYDEDLGVTLAAAVFDGVRRCTNRCIFCFVDQMPPGLRRSLYVKDDDYRLSFWDGNFVTLTNLRKADLKRIEEERLSPLYISVHTTNPELRRKMMRNPRAGEVLPLLRRLANSRIDMHLQIVLCPGVNDGPELMKTVRDLAELRPFVKSIAAVPVGLTAFRDGLTQLSRYTPAKSADVVRDIEAHQENFLARYGTRLLFASDEFYLVAEKTVPSADAYEGFPQLENGVGLVRRFWDGFATAIAIKPSAPPAPAASGRTWVVTGELGAAALAPLLAGKATLVPVPNRFFGPTVTATGLLTAGDITRALKAKIDEMKPDSASNGLPVRILIPDLIFRSGFDVTIDEQSREDLVREISHVTGLAPGVAAVVPTEPETLAQACFGEVSASWPSQ